MSPAQPGPPGRSRMACASSSARMSLAMGAAQGVSSRPYLRQSVWFQSAPTPGPRMSSVHCPSEMTCGWSGCPGS